MVKDGVYFEDQQQIIIQALNSAIRSVRIAVAWINFDEYKDVFLGLRAKDVKVKIIVNDDVINKKYQKTIDELLQAGVKIRFISTPSKSGYMHHKFCVVDNCFYMNGSFNWTKNALNSNFESLELSHNEKGVAAFLYEFKSIWQLSKRDLMELRNPLPCEFCEQPLLTICVFSQDGDYHTKADIYKICDCGIECAMSDYFDISVYNNLISIFDRYDEDCGNDTDEWIEIDVKNYLSSIRQNRMGFPIIHAVGCYSWEWFTKDDGVPIIKILWKEKYIGQNISDQYYLD